MYKKTLLIHFLSFVLIFLLFLIPKLGYYERNGVLEFI